MKTFNIWQEAYEDHEDRWIIESLDFTTEDEAKDYCEEMTWKDENHFYYPEEEGK